MDDYACVSISSKSLCCVIIALTLSLWIYIKL